MQAIQTYVLPATSRQPTRIKAKCERGSIVISWPDLGYQEDNHRAAAHALCNKFIAEDMERYPDSNPSEITWSRPFISAQLPDGSYAHVCGRRNDRLKLIELKDLDDEVHFCRAMERIKNTDGTPAPLWCGIMSSVLKAAKM